MKITRKSNVKKVRIVEHNRKVLWWIIGLVILLVVVFCLIRYENMREKNSQKNAASMIANPASVYCVNNNGSLSIVTAEDGSQSGICTLKSGKQCEEWLYFRGECG